MVEENNIEEQIEDLMATLESMGLPEDYENPACIYAVAALQYVFVTFLWVSLSTE